MYNNIILNLFNNPKNAGRIIKPEGIAETFNFDETIHVEFSIRVESGIIMDCKFRAQANPYYVAVCSTIAEKAKGKMVSMFFMDPEAIKNELKDESNNDISFCIDCIKLAIADYYEKQEKANKNK